MNAMLQLQQARRNTLELLTTITEEQATTIPTDCNNHILWHAGHLYVTLDKFAFQSIQHTTLQDPLCQTYFARGTSPFDWPIGQQVFTLATVSKLLLKQLEQLEKLVQIDFTQPVSVLKTSTGFEMTTFQSMLDYALYHEGMHLGIMKLLKRLTSHYSA